MGNQEPESTDRQSDMLVFGLFMGFADDNEVQTASSCVWAKLIRPSTRKQCDDLLTCCSICVQTPFTLTLRIWDIYILEGERVLPAMSYTILKLHKSKPPHSGNQLASGSGTLHGSDSCVCGSQSTWWSCPWKTLWSSCRRPCPKTSSTRTTLWSSSCRRPWRSSGGQSWSCPRQVLQEEHTHEYEQLWTTSPCLFHLLLALMNVKMCLLHPRGLKHVAV